MTDIADFLTGVNTVLSKYQDEFRCLGIDDTSTLPYFKVSDFEKFGMEVPAIHRRMLITAISKLQTPNTKKIVDSLSSGKKTNRNLDTSISTPTPSRNTSASRSLTYEPVSDRPKPGEDDDIYVPYKTPMECAIAELNDDINVKTVEMNSAKEHLQLLEDKYPNMPTGSKRIQCSNCHLRADHTKRQCKVEPCESAEQCGDLNKHEYDKKEMVAAIDMMRKLEKELKELQANRLNKTRANDAIQDTFTQKIKTRLINSNPGKYLMKKSNAGHSIIRTSLLNIDSSILEKHYRSHMPPESEDINFKSIVDSVAKKTFKKENPIQNILQDKGIRFPDFNEKRDTPGVVERNLLTGTTTGFPPDDSTSPLYNSPFGFFGQMQSQMHLQMHPQPQMHPQMHPRMFMLGYPPYPPPTYFPSHDSYEPQSTQGTCMPVIPCTQGAMSTPAALGSDPSTHPSQYSSEASPMQVDQKVPLKKRKISGQWQ